MPALTSRALLALLAEQYSNTFSGKPLLLSNLAGVSPGGSVANVIDQHAWRRCYNRLAKGTLAANALPATSAIDARIKKHQQAGMVPVALCRAEYVVLKQEYVLQVLKNEDTEAASQVARNLPADAFEYQTSQFLTAFFPDDFHYFRPITPGLSAGATTFILPADLCLTTEGLATLPHVTVDVGDAQGWQTLTIDRPLPTRYATAGSARLQWQEADPGLTDSCEFTILDNAAVPNSDQYLTLTSPDSFQGLTATGHAWVFYGKGNTEITNPLIFSEGFPGGYSLSYLYTSLNHHQLLDNCLAAGIDIILLGYEDGTTYLEANAGVVIDCIQQVIAQMPNSPTPRLRVGGACMGGVITRYALAQMESASQTHDTILYFSVDSPHYGINAPVSLLYLLELADDLPFDPQNLQTAYEKLTTPAGRELLLFTVDSQDTTPNMPDSDRTSLLQRFEAIGEFPTIPYKIGSSNGVDTGLTNGPANGTLPGEEVVAYEADLDAYGLEVYAAPGGNSENLLYELDIVDINTYSVTWSDCPVDFDSVPGSTEEFFGMLADALGVTTQTPYNAFVPSISSLAKYTLSEYDQNDMTTNLSAGDYASYLDDTYSDPQNNPHMYVSQELADFYLTHFTASLQSQS